MIEVPQPRRVYYQVGIIGAGFGGIITALELKRTGRESFVLFERAPEPGGVWRDNVYPGCACDVSSHLYSITSQPNPEWSSLFSGQAELLQYLKDVVERNNLNERIRYDTTIVEARYLENDACWQLTDQLGRVQLVRVLILATGPYSRPSIPSIPGQEAFNGEIFHSSAWNSSISLQGKSVAVIGSGASAIQIISTIASTVARLEVFQRTPAWVLPRGDRTTSTMERWLFRRFPRLQRLVREGVFWFIELIGLAFLGNKFLSRLMTRIARRKLTKEVKVLSVREQLTPTYQIGCKRVLFSDDYYPTFNRPNVGLVTAPIREITQDGIRTEDGQHFGLDIIVMATGFFLADTKNYLPVVGRGGQLLKDVWDAESAQAYLGVHVAGFPNLALLLGPNSGLGHSSLVRVMETQVVYLLQWLDQVEALGDTGSLDVRRVVQQSYNADLQRRLVGTAWASGCKSPLLDQHGRNSTIYPGLLSQYRKMTAKFNPHDYELVGVTGG
jgi:cation diffusion facilitator CzcD-associated flavoprotein CzcO